MNTKIRKRISMVLVLALALTLVIGSFAFFTDRETQDASATAGNIDLVFDDISLAAEGKVYEDGVEVANADVTTAKANQQVDSVWESTTGMLVENGVLNPGDTVDMDYNLKNTGSKSIDVKQQITVTVTDKDGNALALSDSAYEYMMEAAAEAGMTLNETESDAANGKLVYDLAPIVLNGTVESETDGIAQATGKDYDVAMAFDRLAKNAFMESNVAVKLDIQAKQHRNTTDADWEAWATYETNYQVI